jgi:hypothetical protein
MGITASEVDYTSAMQDRKLLMSCHLEGEGNYCMEFILIKN